MTAVDLQPLGNSAAGNAQIRWIATPEGVPLAVRLADRGERAGAFLIDCMILMFVTVVLVIAIGLAFVGLRGSGWWLAVVTLILFALRNFYFTFFELRWQGRTPGKRAIGIRVIDRAGGPLRTEAVVARNLMREVEFFLPLSMLSGLAGGELDTLFSLIWVSVLVLMPMFNRDRLRVGDMVAGTWVIVAPKSELLPDLTEGGPSADGENPEAEKLPSAPAYAFTTTQLDAYGIRELQVLEEVLRRDDTLARETVEAVQKRIAAKIGWTEPINGAEARAFLETYYAQLRARLERRMLLGRRRRDKYDLG